MATDDRERFDRVDWGEYGSTSAGSSINSKLFLLTVVPLFALGIYDWRSVGAREQTFTKLGEDLGLPGVFEAVGLGYDLGTIDYIFIFTLLLFLWYIVLPLVQNPRMTAVYWEEFKRNRPAVVSLIWLLIVFVGGLLGPLFVDVPQQEILASHQPPVFTSVSDTTVASCVGELANGRCHGSWEHPLGTDPGGRDVLNAIIHGMTISMQIGFITTTIVAAIGISFGTISAYSGGWVDEILMRFVDIVLSFPTLPFYLLILYSFGTSLGLFILIFALFAWGGTARYVRSKALSITEEEYIKSARISGASKARVIRRHVVPNTASSIITQLTLLIPIFLLAEAQLAFLGLAPDVHSWGRLIASGRTDLDIAPWITLAPGMALFLTILAFNFLGDALLDALNPKSRSEADR